MAKSSQLPLSGPIHPAIEILSIDDLIADPANLRAHPDKNRKAVAGSVKRFKPWRSIAIDEGNVVYAGNETANACKAAGYTEVVKVTVTPGQVVAVCRTDMTETEKTGYAIADNKTSDTSFFNDELPDALASLQLDGFDLGCLGFTDDELKRYLGPPEDQAGPRPDASEPEACKCPRCGHEFPLKTGP